MTEAITTKTTALALPEQVAEMAATLDQAAEVLAGVDREGGPFTTGLQTAMAMGMIEQSLTDEIMQQWVCPLYGKATGFRADRPNQKNPQPYSLQEIRIAVIEHLGKGGWLVNDELNIIGGRAYQTKSFFLRRLDEKLGAGRWRIVHELPSFTKVKASGRNGEYEKITGALAKCTVFWRMPGADVEQSQPLEFAVKADNFSTSEQVQGKVDRKAAAWLYTRVTGIVTPDGDIVDLEPRVVEGRVVEPVEAAPDEPEAPKRKQEFSKPDKTADPEPEPEPQPQDAVTLAEADGLDAELLLDYCRGANWLKPTETLLDLSDKHLQTLLHRRAELPHSLKAYAERVKLQARAEAQNETAAQPPCPEGEVLNLDTGNRRLHMVVLMDDLREADIMEADAVGYLRACQWIGESGTLEALTPKQKRWIVDNMAQFRMALEAWKQNQP